MGFHSTDRKEPLLASGSRGELLFSSFSLDRHNEQLTQNGQVLKLQPKAFALLCYLAERPKRLITKDELLRALWGDAHVGDAVLKTHLTQVRRAIQDNVHAPRYIQTIHRRGYRFIADVSWAALAEDETLGGSTASAQSIFVGRQTELAALQAALQQSLSGKRRLVFISGEAGIGKTSLVNRFLTHLKVRTNLLLAHGQCVEHHGAGEAYMPILEALARVCRGTDREHMLAVLRRAAPTWLEQIPELGKGQGSTPPPGSKAAPERMLREMAAAIPLLTTMVPLVLIIEDLHWADYSTLELIDYWAKSIDPARFLLIGTYRLQEACLPKHPLRAIKQRLDAHQQCREIHLGFLADHDVARYLDDRFEQHRFSPELAQAIHSHTTGNPLFMVRVVQSLINHAIVGEVDQLWVLTGGLEAVTGNVPDSVVALIERELERLDLAERTLLEIASVAGAEFSSLTVAAAAEQDALLVESVCMRWSNQSRFIEIRRVEERGNGAIGVRCAFLHALYRQVIYQRIGPARQAELHRRIGLLEESAEGSNPASPASLALAIRAGS